MRFAALNVIPAVGAARLNLSEAAIRIWAGLAALAAHGGVGFWMLYQGVLPAAENMPPPAIMMTFSEDFEAVRIERNELTADLQSTQESRPVAKSDAPAEAHRENNDENPDDYLDRSDRQVTDAARDTDVSPYAPPKPRKIVSKRHKEAKPPKETPQAASTQAIEAQARVDETERYAAPQSTARHQATSRAAVTWQGRLLAHLERHKRYPYGARLRGETGTVYVQFTIDDGGKVLSASITRSSGFRELDGEVLTLVRKASPVPAPPADAPRKIIVPVAFSVK